MSASKFFLSKNNATLLVKRDAREDACKGMEYAGHITGLVSDVSADINSIPVLGDMFGIVTGCISAVSHITKAGMDIASTALDCGDIPFEEIKDIMDKKFNELDRKLDKQAEALQEVSKQVSKTLNTVERTRNEMNKGFSRVIETIQDNEIKSKVFSINNIAQYFNNEKNRMSGLPKDEFIAKLEESDGILQHLKESRVPKDGTLQTALSEIIYNSYAIPKNADDKKAFQALYALFYGTQTYASIFCFLLDNHAYLADNYYQLGEYEKFNKETDKIKLIFEDFKSTLVGDNNSFINKVSDILKTVKSKGFVKNNELFKELSGRENTLNTVKADIKKMTLPVIREVPSKPTISFKKPDYNTPLGEFESGKKVRYAVQYEKNDIYSKMSKWSNPVVIKGKASPYIRIPGDRMKRNRLVFRQFDSDQPKLVGVMTDKQTEMRDINRELFDAAGNKDKEEGMKWVKKLKEERDADVNAVFELGRSAVHAAAESGNVEVMKYLFENGFKDKNLKDKKGYTACHVAAENDEEDIISPFLRNGGDCNTGTNTEQLTPLHLAVKNGYRETAFALARFTGGRYDPYVNVNAKDRDGFTPLHMAVGNGEHIVGVLFRQDIDLNIRNKFGLTALHLAAIKNDLEIIKTIATATVVKFNAADINEMTALHYAAMLGNTEIVNYLINLKDFEGYENKYGYANVNAEAKGNKWTPLHYALFFKKSESALELLKHSKININAKADGDVTPLHFAAMTGQKKVASQLLKKGAQKEQKTKEGYTALHLAAMRGDQAVVKLLIEKGASKTAKTNKGKTPLDIAKQYRNSDVQSLLQTSDRLRRNLNYETSPSNYSLDLPLKETAQVTNSKYFLDAKNAHSFERIEGLSATNIDINGMLLLLDVLLKKFSDGKYVSTSNEGVSDLEVQANALRITDEFGKFISKMVQVPVDESIDLAEVHSKIYHALKSGKGSKINSILCSFVDSLSKKNLGNPQQVFGNIEYQAQLLKLC